MVRLATGTALGGILAGLLPLSAHAQAPAQIPAGPLTLCCYSANGQNGSDGVSHLIGSTDATNGTDAGSVSVENSSAVTLTSAGTPSGPTYSTLSITATGGTGGTGDTSEPSMANANGGNGGTATFTNSGTIALGNGASFSIPVPQLNDPNTGLPTTVVVTPVVLVSAWGGTGGSYPYWVADPSIDGLGGHGGTATFAMTSGSISAVQSASGSESFSYNAYANRLVVVDASAGQTIYSASDEGILSGITGGNGGNATTTITSGTLQLTRPDVASGSTTSDGSTATDATTSGYVLITQAHGGWQPSSGGNGGAATVTIGTASSSTTGATSTDPVLIIAEGNGIAGIYAGTNGGDGTNSWDRGNPPGNGGALGTVAVTLKASATVTTSGNDAPAVIAEAVGGWGGAGDNIAGGTGGSAADSVETPSVSVTSNGQITTTGDRAIAIVAQSIGGVGGLAESDGGDPYNGGNGGSSGIVSVANAGSISTAGLYAFGIYALSVGGAGGSGSISDGFLSSQGGGGGNGGDADLVGIVNASTASITTAGEYAVGIVAQSVGGGSSTSLFGSGDFAPDISQPGSSPEAGGSASGLFKASGGAGGAGGTGGSVQVINSGEILTAGGQAFGILAQSIGGNGGDGGNASSVGAFYAVSLGGAGGSGGDAGTVIVSNITDEKGNGPAKIATTGVSAAGIFAQSIGGNGGAGGSANALSGGLLISVSVAIGGSGAGGGAGGEVSVRNNGTIDTGNSDAPAIIAQSIGGGGGRGGQASATAVAVGFKAGDVTIPAISITTAVGGSGGGGGDAGAVTVDNEKNGQITTNGINSAGIKALSVGGGGGDGGNSVTASDMLGTAPNVGITASLGGSGEGGGGGGDVTVTNEGTITTYGTLSNAITAASVGGGGGDGGTGTASAQVGIPSLGTANDATAAIPMGDSITVSVGLGGSGGGGGHGGDVTATNSGTINVHGSNSVGIFAQSVGGGGGMGGGYSGGGTGTLNASVSIGGAGGTASSGGQVTVTNEKGASITTYAEASHGIQAQSVGGGGGAGGSMTSQTTGDDTSTWATVKKTLKEVGKYYSFANQSVKDDINSTATTLATSTISYLKSIFGSGSAATTKEAEGIFADLKNAGSALFTNLKSARDKLDAQSKDSKLPVNAGLTLTFGGAGGAGGDGGAVDVTNDGAVTTNQEGSFAIFAQSVGGGGGSGGGAYSSGSNNLNLTLSIGASGGDGGAGGGVSVNNTGTLTTYGASSLGLLAQSVGGGGGVGGVGLNSQSISISANLNLGGNGGKSSPGGAVAVTNSGSITTSGEESHALVAQSVGGGGGMFVINQADPAEASSVSDDGDLNDALQVVAAIMDGIGATAVSGVDQTDVLPAPAIGLTLGGKGSGGGDGGAVSITQSGSITTKGNNSFGIFAQSIGGGGGFGSDGQGGSVLMTNLTLGAGGDGGPGGSGGNVTLTFDGTSSIATSGTGATAVFLQSVGGGGGYSGSFSTPLGDSESHASDMTSLIADAAASGSGGAILVQMGQTAGSSFSITTSGKNAHGIYAQSIGGSGGAAADENGLIVPITSQSSSSDTGRIAPDDGTGGTITMNLVGSVLATGENSIAIYAQSGFLDQSGLAQSDVAGGAISLDLTGTFTGGSGTGAAIVLDGGAYGKSYNSITVEKGSTVSATSGTAILASFGREVVTNYGTITGNINLASGGTEEANQFDNMAGGTYRTASTVNLGKNGIFSNAGTFDIGGVSNIAVASLTGAFSQQSTGRLLVDVDSSAAAGRQNDVLAVTGAVTLGGQVTVNAMNSLLPGGFSIVTATGGVQGAASATTTVASAFPVSAPITWSVSVNGNTATLTPNANFAGTGASLNPSEVALAQHLQSAWTSGGDGMGSLFASLAAIGSTAAYEQQMNSLSAEENNTPAITQTHGARASMSASQSCPVFTGTGTLLQETDCAWARLSGSRTEQYSTNQVNGYTVNALTYRVGAQKEILTDWFLGVTAAFTTSSVSPANGWSDTDGQAADASVALKRQIGPWLLSAAAHVGFGGFDNDRYVQVGSNTYLTQSSTGIFTAGGRLRAAYEFAFTDWYLKPYADFDVIYTYMPGYSESPAAGVNLLFGDMNEWTFAFSPNLEMGARFNVSPDAWLRPYASVGATFLSNDGLDTETSLEGVGVGVPTYTTTVSMPDTLLDVGLGLQLYHVGGLELRADYKAQIGNDFLGQELSARFSVPF
ncbi:autotransporter outer membrane beta-barrel domain-containing protein [Aquabacter spiritensis]|uniref:autotransporter outer membrane beta-barrel domain-containing protein n=1 Tax=Aquabacter spiritensis TaxID=933073 RepID=UPI00104CECD1|nr:autotransporter outer membrane beta-barrel domain-containing protein [Aquabacter spiritensis]